MPIPKPKDDESKDDFIGRCMANPTMSREYPDRTIRAAICYRSWRENNDAPTQEKSKDKKNLEDFVKVTEYDDNGTPIVRHEIEGSDVEFADGKDGDIKIRGWFMTELANRNGQKVLAEGFNWDGAFDRYNGRVLAFHDTKREPVGSVDSYEVRTEGRKKGIYGQITLFKENPAMFMRAVRAGVLNDFSIGFGVLDWDLDEENQLVIFKKSYLNELSVVNIGAAPEAKFEIINCLNIINSGPVAAPIITKESKLDPEIKKQLESIEQNAVKVIDHDKAMKDLRACYTGVKDGLEAFKADILTRNELSERFEKISEKFNAIVDDLEAVKSSRSVRDKYIVHTDMKSLINDEQIIWLTDDNGVPVSAIEQRAYKLFQMPVNYDKLNCGQELKNLRNLHDSVVLWNAYMKFKRGGNYRIENSRLWKQLVLSVKDFDESVYNAMAGGNTGYGAEFVPTELSSEFNELLRITPTIAQQFQFWQMPRGGSAYYPFQNGKAVAYKGSEATVNNPVEARKTNIATDRKLFTPDVFIGALVSSEELSEDSIIDMEAFIRKELATVLLEGLDSAIINGDTASPHQDNDEATVYETYDLETCFIGLRAMAADDSKTFNIETIAGDTGVGALTLSCFTHMKKLMETAGVRPDQCCYITGVKGRTEVQTALWKEDASGILAYMISGNLPTIDGSPVIISGMYNEALESDGLAGTDADHTSICCVHKPSWRIGQRRGVTVEFDKNILTQQQAFVATARFDFGKICASSIYPVSCGINVQHT